MSQNYVSYGLSDQVSWQAEFQGEGFEDIRSLSATTLLYFTMLLEERFILYGRGTTGNGYTGALGTPTVTSLSAVSASIAPGGTSTLGSSATCWVLVAADAGDLLGTNGTTMHQGPTSTITSAASVTTSAGLTAVQVNIGSDVAGALGYNLYVASVQAGPYYYAGRTGYNVGYITSQPTSGPTTTSGAADASAVSTNFDGMLTNLAASAGYVKRLNASFSTTNPGTEYQTAFATSLRGNQRPTRSEMWFNGFDSLPTVQCDPQQRLKLRIQRVRGQLIGYGEREGRHGGVDHHEPGNRYCSGGERPSWMPQGNTIIRSVQLPLPDANISETFAMALAAGLRRDQLGTPAISRGIARR